MASKYKLQLKAKQTGKALPAPKSLSDMKPLDLGRVLKPISNTPDPIEESTRVRH